MTILFAVRRVLPTLLLLGLASGCDQQPAVGPAPEPLDGSSGAPLRALACGAYRTFTQAQWAQPATAGLCPGTYRDRHFPAIFFNERVSGLVVGIVGEPNTRYLRFTAAAAVQQFLPQTAAPAPLARSDEDPPAGSAYSALAGEVVALKLNLYYDDYERSRTPLRTGLELRHLVVASGPFQGLDVTRLLTTAERVLGDDPARTVTYNLFAGAPKTFAFTVAQLHAAVAQVNDNFEGGTVDRGYLACH